MLEQLVTDAITDEQWYDSDEWDESTAQEEADKEELERLAGDDEPDNPDNPDDEGDDDEGDE